MCGHVKLIQQSHTAKGIKPKLALPFFKKLPAIQEVFLLFHPL